MSKKCYRYFGGLLNTQAKWLNKMAEKGYRLVRTGKLLYEFEKCKPDEVTYCVEFIGEKSKESSIDYANFLEDIGYKVKTENPAISRPKRSRCRSSQVIIDSPTPFSALYDCLWTKPNAHQRAQYNSISAHHKKVPSSVHFL